MSPSIYKEDGIEHDLEAEKILNNDSSIYNIDHRKQLKIDLVGYQLLSMIEIEAESCIFEVLGRNMDLNKNITLVSLTFAMRKEVLKIQVDDERPQRILYLNLQPLSPLKPCQLKYLDIIAEGGDQFLLQHVDSSLYLSIYHRNLSLYLHPLNCGTSQGTMWTCRQGQLRNNNNGLYLKFGKKDNGLIFATAHENATLKSSAVNFADGKLTFTVEQESFGLQPSRYPWTSNLTKTINSVATEIIRQRLGKS